MTATLMYYAFRHFPLKLLLQNNKLFRWEKLRAKLPHSGVLIVAVSFI